MPPAGAHSDSKGIFTKENGHPGAGAIKKTLLFFLFGILKPFEKYDIYPVCFG